MGQILCEQSGKFEKSKVEWVESRAHNVVWYCNNARLRSDMDDRSRALLGTGTERQIRGALRQVYDVSLPTFWLELDVFTIDQADSIQRCSSCLLPSADVSRSCCEESCNSRDHGSRRGQLPNGTVITLEIKGCLLHP